jgi:hypothetical protein
VPSASEFIGVAAGVALALIAAHLLLFLADSSDTRFEPVSIERSDERSGGIGGLVKCTAAADQIAECAGCRLK